MKVKKSATARPPQHGLDVAGNLLFYPGDPANLVFFETLANTQYNESRGQYYAQLANHAYKQGLNYLTNNPLTTTGFLKKDSENYTNKIKAVIDFLTRAVEQERKNELDYFKQKRDLILKSFTPQEIKQDKNLQALVDYLNGTSSQVDNFDYETFIILINSLLQGRDFTAKSITYERNRLQGVEEARREAIKALADKWEEDNQIKTSLEGGQRKRYEKAASLQIKMNYLNTHHMTSIDKNGKTTILGQEIQHTIQQTIDDKMANFINDQINKAWESTELKQKFLFIIQNYYNNIRTNDPITVTEDELKKTLTSLVMKYVRANQDKIVDSFISKQAMQKVEQDMMKQLQRGVISTEFQVTGVTPSQFWLKQLPYFSEEQEKYKSAAGIFNAINNFLKHVRKTKVHNLNQEERDFYHDEELKLSTKNEQVKFDFINRLERYTQALRNLMKREGKTSIRKVLKVGKGEDQKEYTFIFRFDKNGRVVIPDGFVQIFMQSTDAEHAKILQDFFIPKGKVTANTLEGFVGSGKSKINVAYLQIFNKIRLDAAKKKTFDAIEKNLSEVKMNIKGPQQSEIIAALQLEKRGEELVVYWPGHENNKNDLITISTTYNQKNLVMEIKNIFLNTLDVKRINRLMNVIQKDRTRAATEFQKEFSRRMSYSKRHDNFATKGISGYHDYEEKKKAFLQASEKFYKKSEQALAQLDEAYNILTQDLDKTNQKQAKQELKLKYDALRNDLLNSFYRSDTMKDYVEYQNNVGFLGGSIGTSLMEQLKTIAAVMRDAGLTLETDSLALLADIIINTGSHTIIHKRYHRVIETYLGAVAGFMLFDEGGAEASILTDRIKKRYKATTEPRILHLYRLNGIYFPSSYVLNETLKGIQQLDKTITQIRKDKSYTHGATIHIVNNMSVNSIKDVESGNPWTAIGQKALNGGVSLQITFMGGLMQILDNLQARMEQIAIP